MAKNITIYTTNSCGYCHMLKNFLSAKGHSYHEINLDEHPEHRATAMSLSGALTVPVTVITKNDEHQDVVVGYNLAKLMPAIAD